MILTGNTIRCEKCLVILTGNITRCETRLVIFTGNINRWETFGDSDKQYEPVGDIW